MVRRRERDDSLTDDQRRELLDRDPGLFGQVYDPERSAFRSKDAKRRAWRLHAPELLEEYTSERPGCRPTAWWYWDAPDDLEGYPWPIPPLLERWRSSLPTDAGLLAALQPHGMQTSYLREHELLTDAERETLEGEENDQKPDIAPD